MPAGFLKRNNINHETYLLLRKAILDNQIAPGSKLVVQALAEQYQVSATPIKEALAALHHEGLVEAIPRRGYFIPRLEAEDVREIYQLRAVVEGLGARLAAQKQHKPTLKKLQKIMDRMAQAEHQEDISLYSQTDLDMHQAIWEGSGHQRLIRTAETLRGQIQKVIAASSLLPNRLHDGTAEHHRIVEAILQGNGTAAEQAMREHLEGAGELMYTHLSQK
ncbi:GntR family transcriptional regulator [Deinococcus cellulosilyticus]|uniref:GntR family transcriptional regulator n=1 Tax=Deinococcus cellulosilyticus (strain DSM 18568 / NBRC 106333 / KACC 11606 / 5516J-15) TaxID=1223518 RepID=A0A511N4M4_DEIC1|nr:GntR family transcriptional regulator [Deinococcus cellulosilyticus]GEM47386.1 GntR family transcriptional regulator [Deinococcus cellulosilyticus NBRC 106333 = KACC 11606]